MSAFHRRLPCVEVTPTLAPPALAAALACPACVAAQTPQQVVKPLVAQAWIDVAPRRRLRHAGRGRHGAVPGGAMSMIGGMFGRAMDGGGGKRFGRTQLVPVGRRVDARSPPATTPGWPRPKRRCRPACWCRR